MTILFRNTFLGKRECLGKSLAKQEIFIFFVRLLQNFEIHETEEKLQDEEQIGHPRSFLRVPDPFKVVFKQRF